MGQSPFTILLLKRLSLCNGTRLKFRNFPPPPCFTTVISKPFSSASQQPQGAPSHDPPKPTSLSARMSFVFEQIDKIEKQKQQQSLENDDTLQRIRAWRQSKKESQATQQQFQYKEQNTESGIAKNDANPTEFALSNSPELTDSHNKDALRAWRDSKYGEHKGYPEGAENEAEVGVSKTDSVTVLGKLQGKEVEVVHPWPEWIELMDRLVQQNYFDHKRRDDGKMVEELGFDMTNFVEEVKDDAGIDFKDYKTVQTACINFGKDRFDILRSLSRQDMQILVGFGCPNTDKKVVFSAKLLRKHVHLDEGDVCSSCSLRSSCERGYLLTNKEDEARTIDAMRVLLTYGFDYLNGSVVNESVLKKKSVKTVARKLLYEVVKLSAVPIDPNLPPPVIKKPPPKVKQPPPPPKKRVGRDDIEMKKGDWLCPKCDFMNFAKNTVCLQCDAKRPKRQLLPGEWECPECNFLNYRRNMACFHCDCKRPPDAFMESKIQEMQPGPRTRLEKVARQPGVSNAWNFDFDDDESDGADVAAFEYADTSVKGEAFPSDNQTRGGEFRGIEDKYDTVDRASRVHERMYSDINSSRHGLGFDDFDDIDSYEVDSQQNNPGQEASSNVYSDNEAFSKPERNQGSKRMNKRVALSDSDDDFDSDEELSAHPNWKSSHVADSKHRGRGVPMDLDLDSDGDDSFENFGSKRWKEDKGSRGGGRFRNRESSGFQGGSLSGSDYENDGPHSKRNVLRGGKIGSGSQGNSVRRYGDDGNYKFRKDSRPRSNGKKDGRNNNSNNNWDRSHRGSRGDNRRFGGDEHGRQRMKNNMQRCKGGRKDGGFGGRPRGKSLDYGKETDHDPSEFSNSRRVIER
ncbi:putative ankyrin repeat domain protein [Hibiscus syriacus]|uniref:Ankyrin repeat domain protein n=2 Tax=Hibiscus syriacus TaxID=106335 RepID=A0A6A3B8F1_HIBSY|nr:putative ankyrin repeat domain protein [Hibiscus syriacus]